MHCVRLTGCIPACTAKCGWARIMGPCPVAPLSLHPPPPPPPPPPPLTGAGRPGHPPDRGGGPAPGRRGGDQGQPKGVQRGAGSQPGGGQRPTQDGRLGGWLAGWGFGWLGRGCGCGLGLCTHADAAMGYASTFGCATQVPVPPLSAKGSRRGTPALRLCPVDPPPLPLPTQIWWQYSHNGVDLGRTGRNRTKMYAALAQTMMKAGIRCAKCWSGWVLWACASTCNGSSGQAAAT